MKKRNPVIYPANFKVEMTDLIKSAGGVECPDGFLLHNTTIGRVIVKFLTANTTELISDRKGCEKWEFNKKFIIKVVPEDITEFIRCFPDHVLVDGKYILSDKDTDEVYEVLREILDEIIYDDFNCIGSYIRLKVADNRVIIKFTPTYSVPLSSRVDSANYNILFTDKSLLDNETIYNDLVDLGYTIVCDRLTGSPKYLIEVSTGCVYSFKMDAIHTLFERGVNNFPLLASGQSLLDAYKIVNTHVKFLYGDDIASGLGASLIACDGIEEYLLSEVVEIIINELKKTLPEQYIKYFDMASYLEDKLASITSGMVELNNYVFSLDCADVSIKELVEKDGVEGMIMYVTYNAETETLAYNSGGRAYLRNKIQNKIMKGLKSE